MTVAVVWWHRVASDLWPADQAPLGSNLLAGLIYSALAFIVMALLYPPLREAVKRAADDLLHRHLAHHRQIEHEHHDAMHGALHEKLDALDAKLDAITKKPPTRRAK